MLEAKSCFGMACTNQEIYIAGGTCGSTQQEYSLKTVDVYDIG